VLQISVEMGELAKKARDGKLGPADMSGACFTISSLGGMKRKKHHEEESLPIRFVANEAFRC